MLKYYFTPLASAIAGTKLEMTGEEAAVTVVVRAESREDALELGKSIINMEDWELSHSEE